MRLSDSKFIQQSVERSKPKTTAPVDPADFSELRSLVNKHTRNAVEVIKNLDGTYEPVSFIHPEHNRKVYGWLVAVDPDGNGRVEIGEGEYAVVPSAEIRRLGSKENKEKIQAQLKRVLGSVSFDSKGVRADLHETNSPTSLSYDGSLLISLGYASSIGMPTDDELSAYLKRVHPTAAVIDVDTSMPGRVGLAVHIAEDKEAEMDSAVGGELLETLDPDDFIDEDDTEDDSEENTLDEDESEEDDSGDDSSSRAEELAEKFRECFEELSLQFEDEDGTLHEDKLLEAVMDRLSDELPSEDVSIAKEASLEKTAVWPFKPGPSQMVDPTAAAMALALSNQKELIKQTLDTYMKFGGTQALANTEGNFNITKLLEKAIPIVQKANPGLWKQIAQYASIRPVTSPTTLQQTTKTTGPQVTKQPTAPQTGPRELGEDFGTQERTGPTKWGSRRAQLFGPTPTPSVPTTPTTSPNQGMMDDALLKTKIEQTIRNNNPITKNLNTQSQNELVDKLMLDEKATDAEMARQLNEGLQTQTMSTQRTIGGSKRASVFGGVKSSLRSSSSPRRAKIFENGEAVPKNAEDEVTNESTRFPEVPFDHLTKHGLPPSMKSVHKTMSMTDFSRRGDYVTSIVHWDPKCFVDMNDRIVKNQIITYVKANCGTSLQGLDFGTIGKIYVLSLDAKKGKAKVMFVAELRGPVADEVVVAD